MGRYVEIENAKETAVKLLGSGPARRLWLKDLLTDIADHATAEQRIYAPTGETGYIQAHIDQTGIRWAPGGAGGGGTYVIVTGVRRGTSEHPIFVEKGTANLTSAERDINIFEHRASGGGLYTAAQTQGRIYPRGDRNVASVVATRKERARDRNSKNVLRRPALTFQKKGEPRKFRAWVTGQRPQPFVYFSYQKTLVYAKGRVETSSAAPMLG